MVIADYVSDKKNLFRLNSGIFRIFELGLENWNLDSSDYRASFPMIPISKQFPGN